MEIYSSGGDVNLELPTGELEAVKELWQIQPFETKAVIRAKFRASVQRNHTCYLRIRLNGTADHLVVPFEVEVGSSAGLYPPEPIIDLGTVGSEFLPQRFAVSLLNSGKKAAIIEVNSSSGCSRMANFKFFFPECLHGAGNGCRGNKN
jgi:hypothetical protein